MLLVTLWHRCCDTSAVVILETVSKLCQINEEQSSHWEVEEVSLENTAGCSFLRPRSVLFHLFGSGVTQFLYHFATLVGVRHQIYLVKVFNKKFIHNHDLKYIISCCSIDAGTMWVCLWCHQLWQSSDIRPNWSENNLSASSHHNKCLQSEINTSYTVTVTPLT